MKLVEVGEKLSSKDIKEMEGELNLSFPKDYKDFLLKTNGGMPEDEVEFDFIENGTSDEDEFEQGSDIHYFYDDNEIMESYENLVDEELIPDEYLPIACDSFDNQILLCLQTLKAKRARTQVGCCQRWQTHLLRSWVC